MKGLLIKDFCFAKQQRKMYFILACLFCSFIIFQGKDSAAFVISYFTLFGGLLTITSISYDEFDGSMAFLMTLPVTRKQYAVEKYIFGLVCAGINFAVSAAVYMILDVTFALELLAAGGALLLVMTFFLMLMIPVQLKFGGDKGRLVLIIVVAAGVLLLYGIKAVSEKIYGLNLESVTEQMIAKLEMLNPWLIAGSVLIIWIIALIVSMLISIRIMEKKEY